MFTIYVQTYRDPVPNARSKHRTLKASLRRLSEHICGPRYQGYCGYQQAFIWSPNHGRLSWDEAHDIVQQRGTKS